MVGVELMYDGSPLKLSMPQVAAMMLHKLSQICAAQESNKGVGVADAVMSIPAWFTNAQRLAMLDAFEIAGLKCLRLMHDTTAVALDYGIWRSAHKMFDESKGSRVLFVDLGYSSYQVSVVEYVLGKLVVKATAFDRNLGGRNFDMAIAEFVAAEFRAKFPGEDPMTAPKAKMKLLDACEKAKKTLSPQGVNEANLYIECLLNDRDFSVRLTREKFEELVASLLDRISSPIEQVLSESQTDRKDLQSVEIVGGGSRVASVKRKLAATLGLDVSAPNCGLSTTMNADEAIAKGCAMQAAMLSPRFKVKEYVIVEAAPFAIRLTWDSPTSTDVPSPMDMADDDDSAAKKDDDDDAVSAANPNQTECTIFLRNDETPKERRVTFKRFSEFALRASYADPSALPPAAPGQSSVDIGEFKIKGVLPAPPGSADGYQQNVRVHILHSQDGTVTVPTAQLVQLVEDETAAKPAADAMDTGKDDSPAGATTGEKASDAAPPTKKKRKQKKTALVVEAKLPRMNRKAIDAAIELEAQMAHADRVIQETSDMRNELEAYIYKMRDDIIDSLRPYISDGDKSTFEKALNETETWLYDGDGYDSTKSSYFAKLESLKKIGDPVVARQQEEAGRGIAVSAFQQKLEDLKTWANSNQEAYAHITDDEKNIVRNEANKATSWLMDHLDKQSGLSSYEDPVLKTADIRKRLEEVQSVVKPIMNKPKPTPPKDDVKTANAPPSDPANAQAKQEGKSDTPDVDMPDVPKS